MIGGYRLAVCRFALGALRHLLFVLCFQFLLIFPS